MKKIASYKGAPKVETLVMDRYLGLFFVIGNNAFLVVTATISAI